MTLADGSATRVPGYFTTQELADAVGLAAHTIRHHCRVGNIEAQATGREWLISAEAAGRWLKQRYDLSRGEK